MFFLSIDSVYNYFLGEKNFFFSLFMNFLFFYKFFRILYYQKKSRKFLKFLYYYYSRQVLNSGDKISYWHKLKSFVPLLGNLLVLCLLLRQEIDPYHFITRISHNSHYQRLYICILFRSDKQLLWYVYDFSIFLTLIQKFFLHMFWLSRFQKYMVYHALFF